jgi:hypothetical protein
MFPARRPAIGSGAWEIMLCRRSWQRDYAKRPTPSTGFVNDLKTTSAPSQIWQLALELEEDYELVRGD